MLKNNRQHKWTKEYSNFFSWTKMSHSICNLMKKLPKFTKLHLKIISATLNMMAKISHNHKLCNAQQCPRHLLFKSLTFFIWFFKKEILDFELSSCINFCYKIKILFYFKSCTKVKLISKSAPTQIFNVFPGNFWILKLFFLMIFCP